MTNRKETNLRAQNPRIQQAELERLAKRMYSETFKRIEDPVLGRVAKGKVTLLYGPPMVRPDVALVSFQGGGGDRSPSRRTWPKRLLYLDDAFAFGRALCKQSLRLRGFRRRWRLEPSRWRRAFPKRRRARRASGASRTGRERSGESSRRCGSGGCSAPCALAQFSCSARK